MTDGGRNRSVFTDCALLPFDNSAVWEKHHICYGQSMFHGMAAGSSSFIFGELVGPETFMDQKVVPGGQGATLGGPGALKPTSMGTGLAPGSEGLTFSQSMTPTQFAQANPEVFDAFKAANPEL